MATGIATPPEEPTSDPELNVSPPESAAIETEEPVEAAPEQAEQPETPAPAEEPPQLSAEQQQFVDEYFDNLANAESEAPAPESESQPPQVDRQELERRREQALRDKWDAEQRAIALRVARKENTRKAISERMTQRLNEYYSRGEDLPEGVGSELLGEWEKEISQEATNDFSGYLEQEANMGLGAVPGFAEAAQSDPKIIEPIQADASDARDFFVRRYMSVYDFGRRVGAEEAKAEMDKEVKKQAIVLAKGMAIKWHQDTTGGKSPGRTPAGVQSGLITDEEVAAHQNDAEWWEKNRERYYSQRGLKARR